MLIIFDVIGLGLDKSSSIPLTESKNFKSLNIFLPFFIESLTFPEIIIDC